MSFTRLSTCMHMTAVFSLYQLHSVGGGDMDVVHKTINVYAPDRYVFFVPATLSGWRKHGCRSQVSRSDLCAGSVLDPVLSDVVPLHRDDGRGHHLQSWFWAGVMF